MAASIKKSMERIEGALREMWKLIQRMERDYPRKIPSAEISALLPVKTEVVAVEVILQDGAAADPVPMEEVAFPARPASPRQDGPTSRPSQVESGRDRGEEGNVGVSTGSLPLA